jgi:hypothetical protein
MSLVLGEVITADLGMLFEYTLYGNVVSVFYIGILGFKVIR